MSSKTAEQNLSLIIPNYNYGNFLQECIDSVLNQSVLPTEILIIDDASTDHSESILKKYDNHDLIKVIRNESNLGIVSNFSKAVANTSGDWVVFVGADNYVRNDFVEQYLKHSELYPEASVFYSDIIIFGERAEELANQVGALPTSEPDNFLWSFPEPTPEVIENLKDVNFMHGSSMFSRNWYEKVDGYQESDGPEDHDLFYRMVAAGGTPIHVAQTTLYYRQHSVEQANTQLLLEELVDDLRRLNDDYKREVNNLQQKLEYYERGGPRAAVGAIKRWIVSKIKR